MGGINLKSLEDLRVELVAHTAMVTTDAGANMMPVSAARVSHGREDKTGDDPDRDLKLMMFLAEHKHFSPFEHQSLTALIECPMYVRSQIQRHRTFSYNEISRRYTADDSEHFFIPDSFRAQASKNKQSSAGVVENEDEAERIYVECIRTAYTAYTDLLEAGVAREIARGLLPNCAITRFYMTGNLRNWAAFIKLRDDEHAQLEVQYIARKIKEHLLNLWPEATQVLLDTK